MLPECRGGRPWASGLWSENIFSSFWARFFDIYSFSASWVNIPSRQGSFTPIASLIS